MGASNGRVIKAYEDQITALDEQRAVIVENLANAGKPRASFEESFRTACVFLANPWKAWASGNYALKRTVLRLALSGLISYCRNEGVRTASIAEPLRLLGAFAVPNGRMVDLDETELNQIFNTLDDWNDILKDVIPPDDPSP